MGSWCGFSIPWVQSCLPEREDPTASWVYLSGTHLLAGFTWRVWAWSNLAAQPTISAAGKVKRHSSDITISIPGAFVFSIWIVSKHPLTTLTSVLQPTPRLHMLSPHIWGSHFCRSLTPQMRWQAGLAQPSTQSWENHSPVHIPSLFSVQHQINSLGNPTCAYQWHIWREEKSASLFSVTFWASGGHLLTIVVVSATPSCHLPFGRFSGEHYRTL